MELGVPKGGRGGGGGCRGRGVGEGAECFIKDSHKAIFRTLDDT